MQSFGLHRAKVAVILKYVKEQFVFIFFPLKQQQQKR